VHAIEIKHLSKSFGTFEALSQLSLAVENGEFLTLLGPSGCGKTTLLKLISGFLAPSAGSIWLNGKDVTKVPPEERDTALCFQSYALFPHLTVRENLEFGLRQKRLPAAERDLRVSDVSEKLHLGPQLDKLPNQLSGGQQQRVSLGRALAMRPSVILFDEPLSNLDAKLRDEVRVEIRRIQKDYGLTAIYVTHDQAEALAMSDRIVVLNRGRVEQIDVPETLYHKPKTRFVADFIGDANILPGTVAADAQNIVRTPIGTFQSATGMPSPTDAVDVCWRPEHARIGEGDINARVVHRAFQGSHTDLMVETNGHTYRVQTARTELKEGDDIRLSVAPEHVIMLVGAS
jgi:iron(III) transport system ATP-binding protein